MTNTENSFENTEPVCVWMCVCGCGCVYNKVRVIMSPGKPADMITQARLVQLSSGLSWGPLQPRWRGGGHSRVHEDYLSLCYVLCLQQHQKRNRGLYAQNWRSPRPAPLSYCCYDKIYHSKSLVVFETMDLWFQTEAEKSGVLISSPRALNLPAEVITVIGN